MSGLVGPQAEQDLAKFDSSKLKHVHERKLTRCKLLRCPTTFRVRYLVLGLHSPLPPWPGHCLQEPSFGPCCFMKLNGGRIRLRGQPLLGGYLLCTPKQLRHSYSLDDFSRDE